MNKYIKISLFLFFFLVLILLGVFIVNNRLSKEPVIDPKTEEETVVIDDEGSGEGEEVIKKSVLELDETVIEANKVYEEALDNSDVKACLDITNLDVQSICIKNIAVKNKSLSECSNIEFEDEKVSCLDEVNYGLAIEDNNFSMCNSISDKRLFWSCVSSLIENSNDCEDVDEAMYEKCLNLFDLDHNNCEGISSEEMLSECEGK